MCRHILLLAATACLAGGCNVFAQPEGLHPAPDGGTASGDGGGVRDAAGDVTLEVTDSGDVTAADLADTADATHASDAADSADVTPDMGEDRCGNGTVEADEECEPGEAIDCDALGLGGGSAICTEACEWSMGECYSCDVYVADTGVDGATGSTPQDPLPATYDQFQTLFEGGALVPPGTAVCIRRGSVMNFTTKLKFRADGTAGMPITIGAYGPTVEPLPTHQRFDPVDPGSLTDLGDGRYSVPFLGRVEMVWWDDVPLDSVSDTALPGPETSAYDGESDLLYLRPPTPPVAGTEIRVVTNWGFDFQQTAGRPRSEFVTIRDQRFEYVDNVIVLNADDGGINDIRVTGCLFSRTRFGVSMSPRARDIAGIEVIENEFSDVAGAVRGFTTGSNVFSDVEVSANDVGPTWGKDSPGVPIRLDDVKASRVVGNELMGASATTALLIIARGPGTVGDVEIARNVVVDFEQGLEIRSSSSPYGKLDVHHNIFWKNVQGMRFEQFDTTQTSVVAHNTIVGSDEAIELEVDSGLTIVNNIVEADIFGATAIDYHGVDHGGAVEIDHNLYAPQNVLFEYVDEDTTHSWTQWLTAHPTFDVNSTAVDSAQFVSIAAADPLHYRPSSSSDAIGLGTDAGYAVDFGGRPIDPSAVDVGAWQRQPSDP